MQQAYNQKNMKNTLTSMTFLFLIIIGCKKDEIPEAVYTPTKTELTLDSIFLYASETYLWYDALPSYDQFNPRKYTSTGTGFSILEKELFDITRYKINPSTGKSYEYYEDDPSWPKYSYIIDNTNSNGSTAHISEKSDVTLEGQGSNFGLALTAVAADDIRIRYVEPSSPAAIAGIVRGHRLVKIDNKSVRADSDSDINLIKAAFKNLTMSLLLEKTDGTQFSANLTQKSFSSSPVYKKSVISSGNKKIGYLVYARFSNMSNSQSVLDQAFQEFSAAGVTDLIIDLRYNGGGYVTTAEYLTNLIAPSSLNGSVMYSEHYNDLMQKGKATILSNQPLLDGNGNVQKHNGRNATYADIDFSLSGNTYKFSKKGSLNNINKVVFIVTGNTASASELVINSLKPYMTIKLVGSKTYGKPVGFFAITIDHYSVYLSNFYCKNSADQGDYFNGFSPDILATDDVTRDFGDENEVSLSKAIAYITTGTTTGNTNMVLKGNRIVTASSVVPADIDSKNTFKGMVETRWIMK